MNELYLVVDANTKSIVGFGNKIEGQTVGASTGQLIFYVMPEQIEKAKKFNKYDPSTNTFYEPKEQKQAIDHEAYNAINLEYIACIMELGL